MPMVALLVVMALGLAVLIVETARLVGERGGPESFRQLRASVEVMVRVGCERATSRAVAASCRGERFRLHAYP